MMTIDQRMQNAENHIRAAKQAERMALGEQKRLDSRRNYYMGGTNYHVLPRSAVC